MLRVKQKMEVKNLEWSCLPREIGPFFLPREIKQVVSCLFKKIFFKSLWACVWCQPVDVQVGVKVGI